MSDGLVKVAAQERFQVHAVVLEDALERGRALKDQPGREASAVLGQVGGERQRALGRGAISELRTTEARCEMSMWYESSVKSQGRPATKSASSDPAGGSTWPRLRESRNADWPTSSRCRWRISVSADRRCELRREGGSCSKAVIAGHVP